MGQERVLGVEGLSIVHDVGWVTTGGDVSQFVNTAQASVRASIDRADKYRLAFDTIITDEALFMHRQGHQSFSG